MGSGQMTVADIKKRMERMFGDEAGVQLESSDVIRWINDAQREAIMQNDNVLQSNQFYTTSSGLNQYKLGSDVLTIQGVYFRDSSDVAESYYPLKYYPREHMDRIFGDWQDGGINQGLPEVYTRGPEVNTISSIILYPCPDVDNNSNNLKVTYSRYGRDVTSDNDDIDLPAYYYGYVEAFCMMKVYEMDEDWEASDKKAALVQSTIDFNNNRDSWFGRESYPVIRDWQ